MDSLTFSHCGAAIARHTGLEWMTHLGCYLSPPFKTVTLDATRFQGNGTYNALNDGTQVGAVNTQSLETRCVSPQVVWSVYSGE